MIIVRQRPLRLIILGDGSERPHIKQLVRELKLTGCVSLPGWNPNLFSYMRRAAALVLCSRFEGIGGVLIQVLACGCPCVSTDCSSGPRGTHYRGRCGPIVSLGGPGGAGEGN